MANLHLIEELRAQLITDGTVQAQTAAPSTTLPSVWLWPRDGAPEPRAGENITVTLRPGAEVPGDWHEGFLEERIVEVIVRSRTAAPGELVQRTVRGLLHDKREYFLNNLRVEWSHLWRGTQPVTSDETSYTTIQSFHVACRVKSLAGLPYAP